MPALVLLRSKNGEQMLELRNSIDISRKSLANFRRGCSWSARDAFENDQTD